MDDKQVVAAILTIVLHAAEHDRPQRTGTEHWRTVWNDYKRFLKELNAQMIRLISAESIRIDVTSPVTALYFGGHHEIYCSPN